MRGVCVYMCVYEQLLRSAMGWIFMIWKKGRKLGLEYFNRDEIQSGIGGKQKWEKSQTKLRMNEKSIEKPTNLYAN